MHLQSTNYPVHAACETYTWGIMLQSSKGQIYIVYMMDTFYTLSLCIWILDALQYTRLNT